MSTRLSTSEAVEGLVAAAIRAGESFRAFGAAAERASENLRDADPEWPDAMVWHADDTVETA